MTTPPSYTRVKAHLNDVLHDPSTTLDVHAIDVLGAELTASTDVAVAAAILNQVSELLPILQEDPTPVTALATKATAYLNFSQIDSIQPPVNFLAAVKAPSPPINLLALSLLYKAGNSPSDAAIVAGNPDLVTSLVELWLTTSTTAVAQAAFDALWALLEIDHPDQSQSNEEAAGTKARGQGLVWRRIFEDKNVYGLYFSFCNLENADKPGQLSTWDTTVAQGRLLDFIVKAGSLDWQTVSTSHFPEIESSVKSDSLLSFAACRMVDTEDVLLHMTLIHALCELLKINAPGIRQHNNLSTGSYPKFSSSSLEFLISSGLHGKILGYYLDPSTLDPAVSSYLSAPILAYISQYALLYPNHLLQNPQSFLDKLLSRILESFNIPSAQWAHGPVPSGDLNILASLPRVMLLEAGKRSLNPLLSIPSKPLHKDTLHTLGRIFHGPAAKTEEIGSEQQVSLEQNPTSPRAEAVASRILYFMYLNDHPDIWNSVVMAAEIIAMHDTAIAAIDFIKAVATANWTVIPQGTELPALTDSRFGVPTEDHVSRLGPASQGHLPSTGAWALLVPPALTIVLPYLFKDPQTYANFVAGGRGDTESAVWRVATAKYDALVALEEAIERSREDQEGIADLVHALKHRVSQGPWGTPSQIGSRIDALEL